MLHYTRKQLPIFAFILVFFLSLMASPAAFARADNSSDMPTRADVQSQLDALSKQKELTPQDKLVQQDLTETLETIDKLERVKAETTQLRQKVAQAPEMMRKATESLNALSDVDNDAETRKTLATLSLRQLELRVAQLLDDLQTANPAGARAECDVFGVSAVAADPQSPERHLCGRSGVTPHAANLTPDAAAAAQCPDRTAA